MSQAGARDVLDGSPCREPLEIAGAGPVEIIATVDQLEAYRSNAYDDTDGDPEPEPHNDADSADSQPDASYAPVPSDPPARRWPGARGHESQT